MIIEIQLHKSKRVESIIDPLETRGNICIIRGLHRSQSEGLSWILAGLIVVAPRSCMHMHCVRAFSSPRRYVDVGETDE